VPPPEGGDGPVVGLLVPREEPEAHVLVKGSFDLARRVDALDC